MPLREQHQHICECCDKVFWSINRHDANCSRRCAALMREGRRRLAHPPPGNIFTDLDVSREDKSDLPRDSLSSH